MHETLPLFFVRVDAKVTKKETRGERGMAVERKIGMRGDGEDVTFVLKWVRFLFFFLVVNF